MPVNARRVALPMRSASAGSRSARERSGESRWMSAAWTKRKGREPPGLVGFASYLMSKCAVTVLVQPPKRFQWLSPSRLGHPFRLR